MPQDAYNALLAAVYDAPLQQGGWDQAVGSLTRALGGRGATLLFQDSSMRGPPVNLIAITGYPDEAESVYNTHFVHRDDRLALVMAGQPGQLVADGRNLDHAAYLATPMFNDFYRRYGLECGVAAKLFSDDGRVGLISIFREIGRGSYDDDEMRLMQRITPHLMRALQMKRQLDRAQAVAAGLLSGLDRFDQAVFLLDPDGRLAEMNTAAEMLLRQPACPLSVRERRLSTGQPADADALRRTIAAASSAVHGAPPPVLRLVSRDGTLALGLMAVPVRRGELLGTARSAGTLVFVAGPAQNGRVDPTILARQFGLSAAEAQVAAALAMGGTINDISDQRQVSRETVRAQVKQVLAKTGLNSQSRLVALVTRSLASLRRF